MGFIPRMYKMSFLRNVSGDETQETIRLDVQYEYI